MLTFFTSDKSCLQHGQRGLGGQRRYGEATNSRMTMRMKLMILMRMRMTLLIWMMMIFVSNFTLMIITECQCQSSWWCHDALHIGDDDDDEHDIDDDLPQVNSVRINETRAESNSFKTNGENSTESKISRKDSRSSNGDHSTDSSKICRKDSRTSKDLPPVPPREREPPPVPSMESLISRRASSSRNEIYSKLRWSYHAMYHHHRMHKHIFKRL